MKLKNKLLITCILAILPNVALAHDDPSHKGPMVMGTTISVEESIIKVKTDNEIVSVELTKNTRFQLGKHGKPAQKTDVIPGSHLMVVGHKLESGNFGATEVMIHDKQ